MRRDLTELNFDEKQLTAEVTALVLERIAPEELVFLDETARVQDLVSIAVDGVKDAATAELSDRVRPVFRRKTAASTEEQFAITPDRARTIHEAAEQRARAFGAPDDQARILAAAFVASLITRS